MSSQSYFKLCLAVLSIFGSVNSSNTTISSASTSFTSQSSTPTSSVSGPLAPTVLPTAEVLSTNVRSTNLTSTNLTPVILTSTNLTSPNISATLISTNAKTPVLNIVETETIIRYSADEKAALKKFRDLTEPALYREYMKTDRYLIRWIRDTNLNLEEANMKLRKFHQYRIENRIDTLLDEDMKAMSRAHPYEIIYASPKYGSAMIVMSFGVWPLRKSMIRNSAKFLRYIDFTLELADVAVRMSRNTSGTGIVDLNGFSIREQGCLVCLPAFFYFVRNLEDHYPQILAAFHLINTPRIFLPIFELVRPLLTPYTGSILHFHGHDKSDWGPKVLQITNIPPEVLPVKYGGQKPRNLATG